jgi:hypothetical protein
MPSQAILEAVEVIAMEKAREDERSPLLACDVRPGTERRWAPLSPIEPTLISV